jgi:hypothetical protein
MNPIRCSAAALITVLVLVSGCGGGDSSNTAKETTTTTEKPSGIPPLPSPLPRVNDPGTVDPVLGDFPVDETRAVQFAWVSFAPKGRTFTVNLRALDEALKDYNESDLYTDGVVVCANLRQNFAVDDTAADRGATYQTDENPITDERAADIGYSIVAAAVQDLCPDMQVLVDDPEFQVPTPVAMRSILGIQDEGLSDENANKFANYVCQQLDRGTTKSRLVSNTADEFNYPDDLAEELISYIEGQVC